MMVPQTSQSYQDAFFSDLVRNLAYDGKGYEHNFEIKELMQACKCCPLLLRLLILNSD